MGFWAPNLSARGRLARGILGIALLLGGWAASASAPWAGLFLALSGAFALLEAARGWCLARACGIRTRL